MEHTYEKKIEIMDAAMYLFSSNSFNSTSVQDIASYCNISKATIYKIFKSKEDILVEIIKHINKQMIFAVENVNFKNDLSKLEKLEKKLFAFFEHLSSKREFAIMLYQNQEIVKNNRFANLLLQNKMFVLNWFKDIVLEAYGPKADNIIWDIVISLRGLVKEFTYIFITKEFLIKDLSNVSRFLINVISNLIEFHSLEEPLIPSDALGNVDINSELLFNKEVLIDEWNSTITKLNFIVSHSKNISNRDDVLAAIKTLNIEQKKDSKEKYLIDAMFLYLSKYPELDRDIIFLKQLHNKL